MSHKITIIIPVYNVEKYIRQCLDSVINQTYRNLEIIVVDDGSPDNCGAICDEYAMLDERIIVIHKENGGVSDARNCGLAHCTGDYVYIMDSDDYIEQTAIEVLYENAVQTGADVIIADHYSFFDQATQVMHAFFANEFYTDDRNVIDQIQNMVLHFTYAPENSIQKGGFGIGAPWTKLVKTELIVKNEIKFDPYVKGIFDDGLFALSVFQFAQSVSYIQKSIYHYRLLQTSLIHKFTPNCMEVNKRIFQRIREFSENYQRGESFIKAYYARVIRRMMNIFKTYLFHEKFDKTRKEKYKEFIQIFKEYDYHNAIYAVELNSLSKKQAFIVVLARLKLYYIIFLCLKIFTSKHKN